jgi:hypothetical protein
MDYLTHWLLTISGAALLLLWGFIIDFVRTRRESHKRQR